MLWRHRPTCPALQFIFKPVITDTTMKSPIAALLVAFSLAGSFQAHAGPAESTQAQQALQSAMGEKAKDLSVSVDNGVAEIKGWADEPRDVLQARYIVSKVDGVTDARSTQVRTWNATDKH
jgi:osmotically-inducible protein OsmY